MFLLNGYENWALLVLRTFLGIIFIYHGISKLKNIKSIPKFFVFLGICETLGGLASILGLLTQFTNLGFILVMLGAIYHKTIKWKIPFYSDKTAGWEFDFLILGSAIALVLLGAGSYSLDALLKFWP